MECLRPGYQACIVKYAQRVDLCESCESYNVLYLIKSLHPSLHSTVLADMCLFLHYPLMSYKKKVSLVQRCANSV